MNRVKSLLAAAALTFALAVAAGGQNPPACLPGETLTPPCPSAPATSNESAALGETLTPPAAGSVEIMSLVELALDALVLF